MSELDIRVTQWLGEPSSPDEFTLGALRIALNGCRPFTEVEDTVALTTRDAIRVPAIRVAEWLLTHLWRLCLEPAPDAPRRAWRLGHSMAALGGGVAWPALEIAGDGEFVQLSLRREPAADVSAIRYLNEIVGVEVSVPEFEGAVWRFCDEVEARIASVQNLENTLGALREELREERADPALARQCRREARAGFDPGDAPEGFHRELDRLSQEAGEAAVEDLLPVSADWNVLRAAFEQVKHARTEVDLSSVPRAASSTNAKPWQRGAAAAREARQQMRLPPGPLSDQTLSQILGVPRLPVETEASGPITGGYRRPDGLATTRALVRSRRVENQRFFFARLLGMAALMPRSESFLPVAAPHTALQKAARSFGQEFLCPWEELEAWVTEHGATEDAIAGAAETYRVSELLITSTLVNRGKIDRERLARFAD